MLLQVVSSLIHSRETKSSDVIPYLTKVIWNILELRFLVLLSFCLQLFLIVFGNRRKYIAYTGLQGSVWLAYLLADLVATYALGILSKVIKDPAIDPNFIIWAPFLLVHLGGPDTITAYSIEDNELWLRHLLGLVCQIGGAGYVVYTSWNGSNINYVTFPVMVAGIIKYAERTWSLWLGSSNKFRESILPPADPGPNYAKFMDDYTAKKAEGYKVKLAVQSAPILDHSQVAIPNDTIQDASSMHDGFYFFTIFERLFADLILSFQDHRSSQHFFQSNEISFEYAFKVIEVELELMYDKLHTKAVVTYSRLGFYLKLVTISFTLSAFVIFCCLILIDKAHMDYDRIITLVLFIGAIILEIYAIFVLLCSSRVMLWLSKHKNWKVDLLCKFISCLQTCFKLSHTKRWSNLMSQFNLVSFALKGKKGIRISILKSLRVYPFFEKSYYIDTPNVPERLKEVIFKQLRMKSKGATNTKACKILCAHRGDQVLRDFKCECSSIAQSTEVEFDQSLLLWHIATDLCYYSDVTPNSSPSVIENGEMSKLLSNYMLYLLVMSPFLLPNGIGQIRFEDTCAEANELMEERKYISEREQVCQVILRVNTNVPPSDVKGDRSKSVLFEARMLAESLKSLETEKNWSKEKKWEMICHVWVEMLCHAASQCRGLHHAKQLSKGGELLTHVWLLMAHLGITEQFQISQGHARAKLILS